MQKNNWNFYLRLNYIDWGALHLSLYNRLGSSAPASASVTPGTIDAIVPWKIYPSGLNHMNLIKALLQLVQSYEIDHFGISSLESVKYFVIEQGGEILSPYTSVITIGVNL